MTKTKKNQKGGGPKNCSKKEPFNIWMSLNSVVGGGNKKRRSKQKRKKKRNKLK